MDSSSSAPRGLLARLGLHRPELRAWAMYDWAISAFTTVVITAIFPIYFHRVAAADLSPTVAASRFSLITTVAMAIAAILGPVLGAFADVRPWKKRLLAGFMLLGVTSTAGLYLVERGDWELGALLFVLGNIGAMSSQVFYDALLPHVARPDEVHRVSTAGYALGYLGGGMLLALNVAMILSPATFGLADAGVAMRVAFVLVGVWWLLFSLPVLRRVREPEVHPDSDATRRRSALAASFTQLGHTLRELRRYRQAWLFLIAFLIYNDGIGTIIRLATTYATDIGISEKTQIPAIMIVQFVGVPCAFAFGAVASRVGARPAIYFGLAVYVLISVLGYYMRTDLHFYLLAAGVGMVQGGVQALSRSLFSRMIPAERSGEFFGLFGVFEKFAGILGPLVFWLAIETTGSTRSAILAIVVFFVVGGGLLARVNVAEGERAARDPVSS
jgi:UMF1 family MFS transporter